MTALPPPRTNHAWGDIGVSSEAPDRWQDRANCAGVDPELFFPSRGASTREAKAVCQGCEVRAECLDHAIENGEKVGIWGGLSERQRRVIRRQARIDRSGE